MRTVDVNSLGGRIRSLRIDKNLSLKQLSERASVSVSMLSELERNSVDPSLKSLRKIAQALGVSVGYLVDGQTSGSMLAKEYPNGIPYIQTNPAVGAPVETTIAYDANGAPVDE